MSVNAPATWGPGDRAALLAFDRYFSWANTLRTHFEERRPGYSDERKAHWEPYMAYWYGGLSAVTEGWEELGFQDPEVDELLNQKDNVEVLRRYQNGAFHFQRSYFDRGFVDLWERDEIIVWAWQLHRHLARWIKHDLPKILETTFIPEGPTNTEHEGRP
jgi:hypothetical protein